MINFYQIIKFNRENGILFSLASIIFITRIIAFRENSLEPDEFEYLYAVRRCLMNPLPFLGFEAHTTGPFAIYFLAVIKLITGFSKIYQLRLVSFFFFIIPTFLIIYKLTKNRSQLIGIITFIVLVCSKNFPNFGPYYDGTFSYNTEYQLLLVTGILSWIILQKKTTLKIILSAFLVFCLPLIKFQAIPLTCYFTTHICLFLFTNKQYQFLKVFAISIVLLIISWLIFLTTNDILDDFYFVYVAKNLNYISNDAFGQDSINPINFIKRINGYYKFIFVFIVWGGYYIFTKLKQNKYTLKSIILHPFFFSSLFFGVSVITIILGKNDYGHYYIFLFLPTSLLVSDIYYGISNLTNKEKAKNSLYPIVALFLIVNFNYEYLFKSINFISNTILNKPTEQFRFGKPYQIIIDKNLINWLIDNKTANASILSIGWDQSQVMYYLLQDDYSIIHRQSHFFYYKNSFETKNKSIFDREDEMLLSDLKSTPPEIIVDTWNLVTITKGSLLQKYVNQYYTVKLTTKNYTVYKKNSSLK
jgi:hypothetical protein